MYDGDCVIYCKLHVCVCPVHVNYLNLNCCGIIYLYSITNRIDWLLTDVYLHNQVYTDTYYKCTYFVKQTLLMQGQDED